MYNRWILKLAVPLAVVSIGIFLPGASAGWSEPVRLESDAWEITACRDPLGSVLVCYADQEGLVFGRYVGGAIAGRQILAADDAGQPCLLANGTHLLLAFIVEAEDFNTTVKLMHFDGSAWGEPLIVLTGATFLEPSLALFNGTYYLAVAQSGAGDNSVGLSYDVAVLSSPDGLEWSAPAVIAGSVGQEGSPSLAVCDDRLYLAFVGTGDDMATMAGYGSTELYLTSSADGATWDAPGRVTYDLAESFSPSIFSYDGTLHIVWSSNIDENGLGLDPNILHSRKIGGEWTAPDRVTEIGGRNLDPVVVPGARFVCLWENEGNLESAELAPDQLTLPPVEPALSLDTQRWTVRMADTEQAHQKDFVLSNTGNLPLKGRLETPAREDNFRISSSIGEFSLEPGESLTFTLYLDMDEEGNYSETVWVRCVDGVGLDIPIFVDADVPQALGGLDFVGPRPAPAGKETLTWLFVVSAIIFLAIIAVVLFRHGGRSATAVFFTALMCLTAFASVVPEAQAAEGTALLDEKLAATPIDRLNITSDFASGAPIPLHCPMVDPVPGAPNRYEEILQTMGNITCPITGVYFSVNMTGPGSVPLGVTVFDSSSRALWEGAVNLTIGVREYFVDFGRAVETPEITVRFSTEGTQLSDSSTKLMLGALRGSDPASQLTVFRQETGKVFEEKRYNSRTVALAAAVVKFEVRATALAINNRILTLSGNAGRLAGNLTLGYNLSHDAEVRIRMVYYDLFRTEHPFIDTRLPLEAANDTLTISFSNNQSIEFEEGKHYFVCGVYFGGTLVDRFGDGKAELSSSTFIAAAPRIMGASVERTSAVALDGKVAFTVVAVDGVAREIDQRRLDEIMQKVANFCHDNSLGYDFKYITTLPALKEFIDDSNDRSVVINTHGSVLPMPDEYFTEYGALDDTKLLLHCNDRGYLDSSSAGNLLSRQTLLPPVQWSYNEFRITDPWGARRPDSQSAAFCYPRLNNSIAYLPVADWSKSVSTVDISFKLRSYPRPGSRAVLFSFWDTLNDKETGFALNLWKDPPGKSAGLYLDWSCVPSSGNVQHNYFQTSSAPGLGKELWLRAAWPYFITKNMFGGNRYLVSLNEFSSPEKDASSLSRLNSVGNANKWMNDIQFTGNPVAVAGNLPDGSAPLDVVLNRVDFYHSYVPGFPPFQYDVPVKAHSWEFGMKLPSEENVPHYKRDGSVNKDGWVSYSSRNAAGDAGGIEPIETRLIPGLAQSFLPRFGGAYEFDGQCWLEVKGSDQIRLPEFTLEMYVRPDRSPSAGSSWTLVSDKGADGFTGLDLSLRGEPNGANSLELSVGNKTDRQRYTVSFGNASASALAPGAWHKVAAMYDGANLSLRVDGDQVASRFVNRTVDRASCPTSIGGLRGSGLFVGALDEVILSKGTYKANHNHQYEKWLTNISAWMSRTKGVWLNPSGIPFGYLWNSNDTVYIGAAAIDGLLAPIYDEAGEFRRPGKGARLLEYAQKGLKGDEYRSLSLPASLDYDFAAPLSDRAFIEPLYADEAGGAIPAGFIRFGLGAVAFTTVYSPDIVVLLAVLRTPTDYTLNTFASEHYKGETVLVDVKLTNPGSGTETYVVNLTAGDPFGTEFWVDTRNVTLRPGKFSDEVLRFRLDNKSYSKGTYRLFVSVYEPDTDLLLDMWGDSEKEMADLTLSVIDDVRLEVLPHAGQTSNSDKMEIPVRVTNRGGMTSRTVLRAMFLSTTGSLFNKEVRQNITVGPKMSSDFTVVFDPGEMLRDQVEDGLAAQVPFGMYKVVLALYDYNGLRHASEGSSSGGGNDTLVYDMDAFDHDVGRASGASWTADAAKDRAGYLCRGPYAAAPCDDRAMVASFNMRINDITGPNDRVATVEVFDRTANRSLSSADVYRHDFNLPSTDQDVQICFDTAGIGGDLLEFRTFWYGTGQLWETRVSTSRFVESDGTKEFLEVKTRPLDIGITGFEMLAKTEIAMRNAGTNELLVGYGVAGRSGVQTVPAKGGEANITLLHHPSEVVQLRATCAKPSTDRLQLAVTRSVETFLVMKRQTKLLQVEHALALRPADINMTDRQAVLRIKDTLTMEDFGVRDYAPGVAAGYDDQDRKPYIRMTKAKDDHWVEFDLKLSASGWYRLSLEGYAFRDHVVVMKASVQSIPAYKGQKVSQVNLTFVFDQQDDSWVINSTEVQLSSGSYVVRIWSYGAYESRIYPDVPATLLPTHDFKAKSVPGKDVDGKIVTLTLLGVNVPFDSSWIPKIPAIPKIDLTFGMDLFGVFHMSLHDLNGSEVAKIETGRDYYLRIALSIPLTSFKNTSRSASGVSYQDISDRHKQISATLKVVIAIKFEEFLDKDTGKVHAEVKGVEFYQFSLTLLIPLKVWPNPGAFIVDMFSAGAGSEALGFVIGPIWKALKFLGSGIGGLETDVGAGIYLGLMFEMTFKNGKTVDNIKIQVYPLGAIWCTLKLVFLFFIKITILGLDIKVIPVGLELVLDIIGGWGIYIVFFFKYDVSIVLFMMELIPQKWKSKRFDITPKLWIYKP